MKIFLMRRRSVIGWFARLSILVSTLAGCVSNTPLKSVVAECITPIASDRAGPALVGQNYGMALTPLPLNSVLFSSDEVAHSLAVQNVFASRTAAQSIKVSARFVSCSDLPAIVMVRVSFLRADTSPAELTSAWKSVYLDPRATALYSENSLTSDVSNYLIEIRK
jgi:hypothetical protein